MSVKLTNFRLPGGGGGSIFNIAALWQYALGFGFLLVAWRVGNRLLDAVMGVTPPPVRAIVGGGGMAPVGAAKQAAEGPQRTVLGVRGTLK